MIPIKLSEDHMVSESSFKWHEKRNNRKLGGKSQIPVFSMRSSGPRMVTCIQLPSTWKPLGLVNIT